MGREEPARRGARHCAEGELPRRRLVRGPAAGRRLRGRLIARANPRGVLLGYFFGPRRSQVPHLADVSGLRPGDAVLVGKFGHLGILHSTWPLLGQADGWQRQDWPTPVFVRYEELTGRSFHVFYHDNDPNRVLREQQVAPGEAEQAPKDGLMGAGFTESILTRLLA